MPSFLRMGSWIGGDRDGNPYVTADVTRQTLAMQSQRALRFYLEELHRLGGELSLDGRIVHVSEGLRGLVEGSADRAPERKDEPYRRAIVGIYARLAATAWSLDRLEPPHPPVGAGAGLRDGGRPERGSRHDRPVAGGKRLGRTWRAGACASLRRAVDVFGFHLASLDLRQNSDVHARVMAELVAATGTGIDYRGARRGGARRRC